MCIIFAYTLKRMCMTLNKVLNSGGLTILCRILIGSKSLKFIANASIF